VTALDQAQCREMVRSGGGGWISKPTRCRNNAKTPDGYCGVHDPERVAAKEAERSARYNEAARLRCIGWDIDTARAKVWNTLTVASTDAEIVAVVRAALAKIAKLEASK
jgi:hypothetical protein